MEVKINQNDRVIHITGKIDTLTCSQVDEALSTLGFSEAGVIIDLSQCNYLSSAGIRVLLKAKKQLGSNHQELIFLNTPREVMLVFETSGLQKVMQFDTDLESALKKVKSQSKRTQSIEYKLHDKRIVFKSLPTNGAGTHWHKPDLLSYSEAGFGIGTGSPDQPLNFGQPASFFVSAGFCTAFAKLDNQRETDFRIVTDSNKNGFPVEEAFSFCSRPAGFLKLADSSELDTDELNHAIKLVAKMGYLQAKKVFVVAADFDEDEPSIHLFTFIKEHFEDFGFYKTLSNHTDCNLAGIRFSLDELDYQGADESLDDFLRNNLRFDNISGLSFIKETNTFKTPVFWILGANEIAKGSQNRPVLQFEQDFQFEPQKAFLTRILFHDAAKLIVEPLHGGFSAQTFHVTSFDQEGRKLRPTVMKMAHRDLIERESERCAKYALPYIFNNSAVVLGAEYYGETGALRYNFVGIGGESSKLRWLTNYYHEQDLSFLEPIFDKIFLQILKPWYGQPVIKTYRPFEEHDPTATFFAHIYQTVKELFGISADDQYIFSEELKKEILNPYWFLKHEYHLRRQKTLRYPTGICHGDLNMQNILLDEKMNVYLIDFSETHPRTIISDFARLEAIFLVDNAPVENEDDMDAYLNFITDFYAVDVLSEPGTYTYAGSHQAKVKKNYALAKKMRQYASASAFENQDAIPYYIALLEWVLPIVCYGIPIPQRKLSLIVSSILCQKLLTHNFS